MVSPKAGSAGICAQAQIATGTVTRTGSDLHNSQDEHKKGQDACGRHGRQRHSNSRDDRLKQRYSDNAPRHRTDRSAGELHEARAMGLVDPVGEVFGDGDDGPRVNEQKAHHKYGNEKLERANSGAAHGLDQFFAKRPKLREERRQGASRVRRGQNPEVMKLGPDERPLPDRLHWRWYDELSIAHIVDEARRRLDQIDAKPGDRPDHEQQAETG